MSTNPFHTLTHDAIFNAVETAVEQRLTSLLIPRNSYINRVVELELADSRERLIVKFYRPGRWTAEMIQTEHNFVQTLHEQELPVIPPTLYQGQTLHTHEGIHFAVFPKKGGRAINEFDQPQWEQLGRLFARLHTAGALWPEANRLRWTPEIATRQHLTALQTNQVVPSDFQPALERVTTQLLARIQPLFINVHSLLIHGDAHLGNIIHRLGEGLFLVDFDDLCIGPAIQDLWMLLPGTPEQCTKELGWLRSGYDLFREFPANELTLVPALRAMRMIHFAAWCAMQSRESHFNHHFPEWGTSRYWNEWIKGLQEIAAL
jgi:Ser/Thr protein kinase RdoA (MazF antagonist)